MQNSHTTALSSTPESHVWLGLGKKYILAKFRDCGLNINKQNLLSEPDHNILLTLTESCKCINITIKKFNNVMVKIRYLGKLLAVARH